MIVEALDITCETTDIIPDFIQLLITFI